MGTGCSPHRSCGYTTRCCGQRRAAHPGSQPPWPAHSIDGNLSYWIQCVLVEDAVRSYSSRRSTAMPLLVGRVSRPCSSIPVTRVTYRHGYALHSALAGAHGGCVASALQTTHHRQSGLEIVSTPWLLPDVHCISHQHNVSSRLRFPKGFGPTAATDFAS